ncbi:hypothetical protein CEE37_00305 [candidate division LCP-89 bacterium B3_LCP]|uniref:Thioredoxin domain-containing protein n=1 Tax=candidate division LCP-89 bacterium B3_LCP TaxID=2012998 RepID=A0A532V4T6_UNCL8|nr:MAG: hypothetical protein CEE37_00305 [candidate division LCP-89 bacterium B3_LCP]
MKSWLRWTILTAVVFTVFTIIIAKRSGETGSIVEETPSLTTTDTILDDIPCCSEEEWAEAVGSQEQKSAVLPRLLELGSVGCRSCDMMAPIIDELKEEYAGRLSVEFYDVRKDPTLARQYRIRIIPTQIFLETDGKEFFRHEGFLPKDEILTILDQMGVSQ